MNIKSAKQQIKNAVEAYLMKETGGEYYIGIEKQRPILLMGAPGIGKTAIMEQIAGELSINLVSYSMTHHTRQSAIGLPFITEKIYDGQSHTVSEYTMSEIIASVYESMEKTGIKEGILFLDEINCISETLSPAMLQFLQYKIFGKHRLPEGWVVVSAGNPPEYNNSVREYDVATLDRLKKITVEPDYGVWKEYAYEKGVHAAILAYLDLKQADFYLIQTGMEGKSFVTARGWEDLSIMMQVYEKKHLEVDEELIGQYLQHRQVSVDFAIYYELYEKYKAKYKIDQLLEGIYDENIISEIKNARFDERMSLIGAAIDTVNHKVQELKSRNHVINHLYEILKQLKVLDKDGTPLIPELERFLKEVDTGLITNAQSNTLTKEKKQELNSVIRILNNYKRMGDNFPAMQSEFEAGVLVMKELVKKIDYQLQHLFLFMEKAFGESQEMMILMSNLTMNSVFIWFLSKYGCEKYYVHQKELLFSERENELLGKIEKLEQENKL